jgi:hypothetical protein
MGAPGALAPGGAAPGQYGAPPTGAPVQASPPQQGGPQQADWYPDPQGQARLRYWDGRAWTDHTSA